MSDPIRELYENRAYPPMSHPLADPAVTAVAAGLAGINVPHPRRARILEIGCSSGHHLIPLAQRWPESRFTGIDLSQNAIRDARGRAAAVDLANLEFLAVDLRDFQGEGGPFDFIIAHGFFSWVPDEVKSALLAFCRAHLSPSGIATVSFNLESGWKSRFPVIHKVRAIQQAMGGDEMAGLAVLKEITAADDPESAVIEDMLAKGPNILPFDDFAPVNDAWPLDQFARAAAGAGLRWLGESDPAENFPACLDAGEIAAIKSRAADPLAFQLELDQASGRTFRSGLLCLDDAPPSGKIPLEAVLGFSMRLGRIPEKPAAKEIYKAFQGTGCHPPPQNIEPRLLCEMISRGELLPRIETVEISSALPEYPKLDAFRLLCAHGKLPVVDSWLQPCGFPAEHYEVLARMDGSRSFREIGEFAARSCPALAFRAWIEHLAGRGFFS